MSKLQAIQVDADTIIYIEAAEDLAAPIPATGAIEGEVRRGGQKGGMFNPADQMAQSFKAIESTIKTYTKYTLNAFRDASLAEVKKVSLEFGVNVSGVGGVPYIATGTAGCNIKITVECAFPDRLVPQLGTVPPPPPFTPQPAAPPAGF
jgi:Trypsin-co-occurring domain 1